MCVGGVPILVTAEETAVAEVSNQNGTNTFASFKAALDNAGENDTIKIIPKEQMKMKRQTIKPKRIISTLMSIVICLSLLPSAVYAEDLPTPGWHEDTKTYYVVGTNGYLDEYGREITLEDGATLDLTYADDFNVKYFEYKNIFNASGNVTIKGDGNPISFDSRCIISSPNKDYTLTLDNLNWSNTSYRYPVDHSLYKNTGNVTIIYKGNCTLPELKGLFKSRAGTTVTFKPADNNSILNIKSLLYYNDESSETVIFDGGKVNISKVIKIKNVSIINGCNMTVSGDDALGIRIVNRLMQKETDESALPNALGYQVTADGKLLIKNSTVSITPGRYGDGYVLGSDADPQYNCQWYYGLKNGLNTSSIEIDNSKVTVDTSKNDGISGIGGVADIHIKNNSEVSVTVSNKNPDDYPNVETGYFYLSAVGGMFGSILIENSNVTANGGNASGIGTGYKGFSKDTTYFGTAGTVPTSTINIKDSTVNATSLNGAAIGTSPVWNYNQYKPQKMDVKISGNSKVVARSINGGGIGGPVYGKPVIDPDEIIINPGIGGWDNGNGGGMETYSLIRTANAVEDSTIPTEIADHLYIGGQTLTVESTDSGKPTILAESGRCAVAAETVTTDTTIIQNTLKTAVSQTTPIKIDGMLLANVHNGYNSVARTTDAGTIIDGTQITFDAITDGIHTMTCGGGSEPAPLVSWSGEPVNGSEFRIVENQINSFWTLPKEKIGGSVNIANDSTTGSQVTEAVKNTTLYANISGLTPNTASENDSLEYQWYKNGAIIVNAENNSYTPQEVGQYYCVVKGTGLYYGSVASNSVIVKNNENDIVPTAPELESFTKNSITLKAPTDGKTYEYSINGGQQWQDELIFDGLSMGTVYNIIRREKTIDDSGIPSMALTVKTANDVPNANEILALIDYENEKLTAIPENVNFYSDDECRIQITSLTNNGDLTRYIADSGDSAKCIYARYCNVTDIGDGSVAVVEIPARPAAPTLQQSDVSAFVNSITVFGLDKVQYTCNGETKICTDTTVIFEELNENTEYDIKAKIPANNENKNFSSSEATISVKTLTSGNLTTTILIPSGTTSPMEYDLSDIIELFDNYTLPNELTSNKSGVSASVEENKVTITLAEGTTGTATLTGTDTNITVKIVTPVGESQDGKILWLWETVPFDVIGITTAVNNEFDVDIGTVYRLTPVYAYGKNAVKRVTEDISAKITLPYWRGTTSATPYVLYYQNQSTQNIAKISGFIQTENGVELTRTQEQYGLYGFYSVEDISNRIITFNATGGTVSPTFAKTDKNGRISNLPTPVRSGHTFVDWYTTADGDTKVSADMVYTEDTTIYAQWKADSINRTVRFTVKFDTDGGSRVANQNIKRNDTANEPAKPTKEGYVFDGWYTDSKFTAEYDFNKKVTKNITIYAKWVESENQEPGDDNNTTTDEWKNPFIDIKEDDWFFNGVKYVNANNLMRGTSNEEFSPYMTLTRGMFVTILYRLAGEPAVNKGIPFSDVNASQYYASAVIWAEQNGIISGINETEFAPDENITREQIAVILYRYAQAMGYDVTQGGMKIREFEDFESISEYAVNAMTWTVNTGLIIGRTETTLNPGDNATRAEITVIIQRFSKINNG